MSGLFASGGVVVVCAFAVWDAHRRAVEFGRLARLEPTRWLADAGGETAASSTVASSTVSRVSEVALRQLVREAAAASDAGVRRARCRQLSLEIDARLSRSGPVLRAHWRVALLAGGAGVLSAGIDRPLLACLTAGIAAISAGVCAHWASRAREERSRVRHRWQKLLRALEQSRPAPGSFQSQ